MLTNQDGSRSGVGRQHAQDPQHFDRRQSNLRERDHRAQIPQGEGGRNHTERAVGQLRNQRPVTAGTGAA